MSLCSAPGCCLVFCFVLFCFVLFCFVLFCWGIVLCVSVCVSVVCVPVCARVFVSLCFCLCVWLRFCESLDPLDSWWVQYKPADASWLMCFMGTAVCWHSKQTVQAEGQCWGMKEERGGRVCVRVSVCLCLCWHDVAWFSEITRRWTGTETTSL